MNRIEAMLLGAAADALSAWAGRSAEAQKAILTACRELPLWLRRHGLLGTLAFLANDKDADLQQVASGFVNALHAVAPINDGGDARARVAHLATESLTAYLLHSRIALALADAFARLAEPLLPAASPPVVGDAAGQRAREPAEEPADAG